MQQIFVEHYQKTRFDVGYQNKNPLEDPGNLI